MITTSRPVRVPLLVVALLIGLSACSGPGDVPDLAKPDPRVAPTVPAPKMRWQVPSDQFELAKEAELPVFTPAEIPVAAAPGQPVATGPGADPVTMWSSRIRIYVDSQRIVVPEGLGVLKDPNGGVKAYAGIHTLDDSGLLRLVAPPGTPVSLKQLFTLWELNFDSVCVGDACAVEGRDVLVYMNGDRVESDPQDAVLVPGADIVVWVGRASPPRAVLRPTPVPAPSI